MKIKLSKSIIDISDYLLVIVNESIESEEELKIIFTNLNYSKRYRIINNVGSFFNFADHNLNFYENIQPGRINLLKSINSIMYVPDKNILYIKKYKKSVNNYEGEYFISKMRNFIIDNSRLDESSNHFIIERIKD